ncbi:DUF4157 domain-containing protein [Streptomyces sp. NPDC094438]|uniref:eCIS core domain-containing protein n=1 Tax=Streptomyces sp. NPDC094438 TaxID=3366061 RepID=UPI0037F7B77C
MRTQDNGKTGYENGPSRAPAVRTGPSTERQGTGAPSAQGLLAFQSAAGNAATVQMLRRSGHAWAQEQHQHGAGCGHRSEQPQVQRSAVHDVLRAGGKPLDDATRTDMESRLGADFSDVRIHNDSAARASAAEVGARAFTSGSHVVIGEGGADKHTLAHELTHVIQQRQGPVAGTDNGAGLKVSDPSDRFEREAEANAQRVMAGPAPVQRTATADGDSAAPAASEPTLQRATGQEPMEMELDPPDFSDAEEIDDGGYDSEAFEEDYQKYLATRDQLPRDTTATPQPAAGFGKSTYGIHPSKVKTLRQDKKQGRAAPELRYRQDNHLLYRWDKRAPGEILGSGFAPWNEKLPPSLRHYQKLLQRTGFVSTTRSEGGYVPDWARQTDGSGYRYVINAPGGIDLVDTLGTVSFVQQQEVIFWKGIRPEFILRVEKCNAKGELIEVIHNTGGAPQQPQQGDAMEID